MYGELLYIRWHVKLPWPSPNDCLTYFVFIAFTKTIKKGDSFHMGYLGQKICERMVSWEFCNFFWNDKSCCYNLPFLFKNSKSIDIHDVSYGNICRTNISIPNTFIFCLGFAEICKLYTFQTFNSWNKIINLMYINVFEADFSQSHYKVVLYLIYLFLTQNNTSESNFQLEYLHNCLKQWDVLN